MNRYFYKRRQLPGMWLPSVAKYVAKNMYTDINLDDLAYALNIDKYHLTRVFERKLNMTPVRWIWCFRAFVACEILKNVPSVRITDIAFACGFNSSSHFSRVIKELVNQTPKKIQMSSRRITDAVECDPAKVNLQLQIIKASQRVMKRFWDITLELN